MKKDAIPSAASERRLERAAKHVTNLWFPINPAVLESVREDFTKGTYEKSPELLLEALKKDFALFTFIVKKLIPVAKEQLVNPDVVNNPAELLRWAGPARIQEIVNDDSLLPSSHMFHSIEPFQAERLRETAIVASTAEVLSEKNNLDPHTGFGRGVIREIGLNLIAWNYPTLYSRVLKNLSPNTSLDEELTKELGFSPSLLAMRIIHPHTLEDTSEAKANAERWETYDRLCEIGEALARAENPDTYPSAENDWNLANDYLQKTVGSGAINLIKNRAVEHSKEYQEALASTFEPLMNFNPVSRLEKHKKRKTALKNRYLQQCPPEVQEALRSLYEHMANSDSTKDVLEELLRTIIPKAGYTGGCVFVVDPAAFALMPRTVFGSVKLRDIQGIGLRHVVDKPIDSPWLEVLSHKPASGVDSAATALSCAHPVVETREESAGEEALTGIYGALGDIRKFGVLYLEAPESAPATGSYTLGTFKAMRQALCDALQID